MSAHKDNTGQSLYNVTLYNEGFNITVALPPQFRILQRKYRKMTSFSYIFFEKLSLLHNSTIVQVIPMNQI